MASKSLWTHPLPHSVWRLSVCINLAATVACAITSHLEDRYEAVMWASDLLTKVHAFALVYYWAWVNAAISPVVLLLFLAALLAARGAIADLAQDMLFAAAVLVTGGVIWTTSMGHAEPNWARGYCEGLIAAWVLWTACLVVDIIRKALTGIRARVYFYGTLAAAAAFMGILLGWVMQDLKGFPEFPEFPSDKSTSSAYLLALFVVTVSWVIDLLIHALTSRRSVPLAR